MSIKVIAIGNRLMGDDGLAVSITESLQQWMEDKGIEVFIGETDFEYCLDRIEEGNYVVIIDATCFGVEPGTVTVNSIKDLYKLNNNPSKFSQHGYSLIGALKSYEPSINGIAIGVEGYTFDFCFDLSGILTNKLECIRNQVKTILMEYMYMIKESRD